MLSAPMAIPIWISLARVWLATSCIALMPLAQYLLTLDDPVVCGKPARRALALSLADDRPSLT